MVGKSQPSDLDQPPPHLFDRLYGYLQPFIVVGLGLYYVILTALTSPLLLITDPQLFHHKSFAKLWSAYGAFLSSAMPPGTPELISSCSGTILDVGPGSGTQVHLFDPTKVERIYAVEPAVDLHAELRDQAEKAGLGGRYEILGVGVGAQEDSLVPELVRRGMMRNGKGEREEGIFDEVVCIRVLCGVPDQTSTIANLYHLLKPGGRFIVCEHVQQPYPNGGDLISSLVQKFCMKIGWSFWLAGCCLDRDTDAALRKVAGPEGWESVKVTYLATYSPIPYLVGEYIKAR